MPQDSLRLKADAFNQLHHNGKLLKLPNIWSPIGARILEAKGYPAIATASAALSSNFGYADGERISRSTLIEQTSRIANSVEVPVTADIEAGFADTTDDLAETIHLLLENGVAGINIEDSLNNEHHLRSIEEQCERISIARATAKLAGINLFINARIDAFICPGYPDSKSAIEEIKHRSEAYIQAGASGLYPIGTSDLETAKQLRDLTDAPINLLATPSAATPSELQQIGINRLSFGPFVFRSCLQHFENIVDSIKESDDYSSIADAMPGAEVSNYLSEASETEA